MVARSHPASTFACAFEATTFFTPRSASPIDICPAAALDATLRADGGVQRAVVIAAENMTDIEIIDMHGAPRTKRAVRKVLTGVPADALAGLQAIVLTGRGSLKSRRKIRAGGRAAPENECLGFYHRSTRSRKAWIELVVDNILPPHRSLWERVPIETERRIAETLYHEIAHHLDAGRRRRGNPEDAADAWARAMWREFVRRRYSYLVPIARLLLRILRRWTSARRRAGNGTSQC
jgi:hypothetical protein